jgi:two-component system, NarL family, response regulator LiaR
VSREREADLAGSGPRSGLQARTYADPTLRYMVRSDLFRGFDRTSIVAGASGYMLKSAAPEAIIDAVSATAAGESVLSPQIAGKLLERIRERDIPITTASHDAGVSIRAALTERELEIFKRLASGESNQDIGRELSRSANTVANHISSILAKLHLDNRIQAAVQAVRSGIA